MYNWEKSSTFALELKESCLSGRKSRTRNAVYAQAYRGFESPTFRKKKDDLSVWVYLSKQISFYIARMLLARRGIRGGRAQRGRCPRIPHSSGCQDIRHIFISGSVEVRVLAIPSLNVKNNKKYHFFNRLDTFCLFHIVILQPKLKMFYSHPQDCQRAYEIDRWKSSANYRTLIRENMQYSNI